MCNSRFSRIKSFSTMLSNFHFQDVKPGDVLQKKNMWEIIGEGSAGERSGLGGKVNIQIKSYTDKP